MKRVYIIVLVLLGLTLLACGMPGSQFECWSHAFGAFGEEKSTYVECGGFWETPQPEPMNMLLPMEWDSAEGAGISLW